MNNNKGGEKKKKKQPRNGICNTWKTQSSWFLQKSGSWLFRDENREKEAERLKPKELPPHVSSEPRRYNWLDFFETKHQTTFAFKAKQVHAPILQLPIHITSSGHG